MSVEATERDVARFVDPARLARFLERHMDGAAPDLLPRVELVGQGRSNLTFAVHLGDTTWILRRPPAGDLASTAHDVVREFRVLEALAATSVPSPRPIVACEDTEVIGAPFYVMEHLDGLVVHEEVPSQFGPSDCRRMGEEMIDALAELHLIDPVEAGLDGLGEPDGYLRRQVRRWSSQLDRPGGRQLDHAESVRRWLVDHLPESGRTGVVHGDFQINNVMFSPAPPVRLLAILDWELATVGDPLADLGWLLTFWPEPGEDNNLAQRLPTVDPGFPSRAELVDRYEQRVGGLRGELDFYLAFSYFKQTVIAEGLYRRHLAGDTHDEWYARLEQYGPSMIERARAVAGL